MKFLYTAKLTTGQTDPYNALSPRHKCRPIYNTSVRPVGR